MSFPESTWGLQPLRTVYIQNTDFSKFLSSPEAFQLQTNSEVPRACYILLLGEKLCSEMKSSALSSHLIPSRTGTVKSLVCLCGSAPHILAICIPNTADSTPFGSFTGTVKRNALKSLRLTEPISQSRTIQALHTQRWVTGNTNKTLAESHISNLSLSCFQWATEQTQSGWASPPLISTAWKLNAYSRRCC